MSFGVAGLTMPRALTAVAVALGMFAWVPLAHAQGSGVKAAFEKFDLLGTLSTDCNADSAKDGYLINRAIDADYVELDRMTNGQTRQFAAVVDKAEIKGNEIAVSYTIDNIAYTAVVRVDRGRMRWVELVQANGQKLISEGRNTGRGTDTQWYSKCTKDVVIQSSPDAGGKCLDVPAGQFKVGARLQTWDCNDKPAQTFAFDALNGRLSIGGFCVQSGNAEQLQLAACNGSPGQAWKTAANGKFVRLVGLNDLCADIANASKDNKAAVGTFKCHGGANQSWILRAGLNLTIDDRTGRDGDTIREFNLPSADVKLCQQACVDEKKCSAWNYRGPGGRTDKQPHCWLRNNVGDAKPSDSENASGRVRPEAPK